MNLNKYSYPLLGSSNNLDLFFASDVTDVDWSTMQSRQQ